MLTQSDIFADLKRKRETAAENGWTADDYAVKLGLKSSWAKEQIRRGVKDGTIETVGWITRQRCDGMTYRAPAYRFTNAATTKAKARNR